MPLVEVAGDHDGLHGGGSTMPSAQGRVGFQGNFESCPFHSLVRAIDSAYTAIQLRSTDAVNDAKSLLAFRPRAASHHSRQVRYLQSLAQGYLKKHDDRVASFQWGGENYLQDNQALCMQAFGWELADGSDIAFHGCTMSRLVRLLNEEQQRTMEAYAKKSVKGTFKWCLNLRRESGRPRHTFRVFERAIVYTVQEGRDVTQSLEYALFMLKLVKLKPITPAEVFENLVMEHNGQYYCPGVIIAIPTGHTNHFMAAHTWDPLKEVFTCRNSALPGESQLQEIPLQQVKEINRITIPQSYIRSMDTEFEPAYASEAIVHIVGEEPIYLHKSDRGREFFRLLERRMLCGAENWNGECEPLTDHQREYMSFVGVGTCDKAQILCDDRSFQALTGPGKGKGKGAWQEMEGRYWFTTSDIPEWLEEFKSGGRPVAKGRIHYGKGKAAKA